LANTGLTPRTQKLQIQEKQLSVECWKHRKRQQNSAKIDEMAMRQTSAAAESVVEVTNKNQVKSSM